MIKKEDQFDIRISDIAFHGKGLARINDFVVFVDQAIPLDFATIRITKKKKKYAEAKIVSILEPSPFRIEPPCIYNGICGGCTWQYLKYHKQLEYKQRHVQEALEHIGLLKGITVHPTIGCEKIFEYRNKMEFSCSDRPWLSSDELDKQHNDIGFALGFHASGTFSKVIDTHKCLLQPEPGNLILNDVRTYIKNSSYKPYDVENHRGFWRFIMLRHSVAKDQWMVNIITAKQNRAQVQPLADMLISKHPQIVSVVNNITSRKAAIAVGEYEIPLAGESFLTDRINNLEFEISANSFFQTNTTMASSLYKTAKDYAQLSGKETVFDLYSGTGGIALYLANSAHKVTGFEIVKSAVNNAIKNCKKNRISNCSFIHGDIKDSLSNISEKPDVIIIDPPRTGIHKNVLKKIIDMESETIVYVSCNPATLARDLSGLNAKYTITEIQPIDVFPNTYHIESVVKLKIKRS